MIRTTNQGIDRRRMLAASGGAVVGGLVASSSALAALPANRELKIWEERLGLVYSGIAKDTKGGRRKPRRFQLLEIVAHQFDDPQRPGKFREPFSLFFLPDGSGEVPPGEYDLSNPKGGNHSLFLNDVMDYETGAFVVEAVFG